MRQLALPLVAAQRYGADFIPAKSNEAARHWLSEPAAWPHSRLALWGDSGTGKTHLLHLWAEANTAVLLAGSAVFGLGVAVARPVAIDDADACADEAALLHTLNRLAESAMPLLLAARLPPARWPVRLPDLVSRLRATTAVAIALPEDELRRALLNRLLAERQVAIPPALSDWLLLQLPRTAAAVREAAELLQLMQTEGERITRRLLEQRMIDLLRPAEEEQCQPHSR